MGNGVAKVLGKKDDDALLKIFIAYDKDDSDSLDMKELLCIMDDLKFGHSDPADNQDFLVDYLLTSGCDENDDQQLDFREFKLFCRYAKKHAKKKKTVSPSYKRAHLSNKVERDRHKAKEDRIREKVAAAALLAAMNKERKRRIRNARAQPKSDTHLNKEQEAARAAKAAEVEDHKANRSKSMHDQTKELNAMVKNTDARVDDALDEEQEAARAAKAAEVEDHKANRSKSIHDQTKELNAMVKNTDARVDDALDEEQEAARAAKAAEVQQHIQEREVSFIKHELSLSATIAAGEDGRDN